MGPSEQDYAIAYCIHAALWSVTIGLFGYTEDAGWRYVE